MKSVLVRCIGESKTLLRPSIKASALDVKPRQQFGWMVTPTFQSRVAPPQQNRAGWKTGDTPAFHSRPAEAEETAWSGGSDVHDLLAVDLRGRGLEILPVAAVVADGTRRGLASG